MHYCNNYYYLFLENTILASVLSPIIVVSGVCNIVLVIVVIALCWKVSMNLELIFCLLG